MPEYLQNNPVPQDAMIGVDYDLKKWLGEHPPSTVRPALDVTIAHLRSEGVTDIAAVGYCFGGRYVFHLAFEHAIKVGAVAHPSIVDVPKDLEKLKASGVPIFFATNEIDPQFPPDSQAQADKILGSLGEEKYLRKYWAGMIHGFAVRGDMSDAKQKKGKEEALEAAVDWIASKL
ncbi:MAG: hypothetical protein CYPHOPRED_003653 [Cyphobasidiales sp. Tagirdzhanova-0007]|nr:MAG: hypothetical protein CYPHOPRED_003653 [Cyphobasidiales sp. Tagirdzhanova-0007]